MKDIKTAKILNIQDEVSKIHQKYGISEMANYKIQLLFEQQFKAKVKTIRDELNNKINSLYQKKENCENDYIKSKDEDEKLIISMMNVEYSLMIKELEYIKKLLKE